MIATSPSGNDTYTPQDFSADSPDDILQQNKKMLLEQSP